MSSSSNNNKKSQTNTHKSTHKKSSTTFTSDPRFAPFATEPRFHSLPKKRKLPSISNTAAVGNSSSSSNKNKVILDDRFKALFDKKSEFNNSLVSKKQLKIDARGRKLAISSSTTNESLNKFYELEKDERLEQLNLLARGQGPQQESSSSSSSEDNDDNSSETSSDESDNNNVTEQQQQSIPVEATPVQLGHASGKRLAIVNCDWERIRAVDLLSILESFCPSTGRIIQIAVYPSQFGLEQMAKEAALGPQIIPESSSKKKSSKQTTPTTSIQVHNNNSNNQDQEEELHDVEGSGFDSELLRAYEKSKLRYYFAVCTCDSVATASHIYDECDGVEFEHSAVTLDLRFMPDDMEEIKVEPRDVCKFVPDDYQPLNFENKALKHTRVDLTWDDDDPYRKNVLENWESRRGNNLDDLNQFIASSSSSSSSDEEEQSQQTKEDERKQKNAERLRSLLLLKSTNKTIPKKVSAVVDEEDDEEEEDDDEEDSSDDDDKQMEIANLYQQRSNINNTRTKNNKKQHPQSLSSNHLPTTTINTKDERFSALFNDPTYSLDPTDPRFKSTSISGTNAILKEKRTRHHSEQDDGDVYVNQKKKQKR
jgi:hypothetical protein